MRCQSWILGLFLVLMIAPLAVAQDRGGDGDRRGDRDRRERRDHRRDRRKPDRRHDRRGDVRAQVFQRQLAAFVNENGGAMTTVDRASEQDTATLRAGDRDRRDKRDRRDRRDHRRDHRKPDRRERGR